MNPAPGFEPRAPRDGEARVARTRIPFLGVLITVSGADEIRRFENDPDVGRPGDGPMPAWFSMYLKVSKFFCPQTNRWFTGFLNSAHEMRHERMRYIVERIDNGGYTEDDVEQAATLLSKPGTTEEVAALCTRMVGRLFLEEPLPDEVCDGAWRTILNIRSGPLTYWRAMRAQSTVYEYVSSRVPAENVEDVCHNLGAAAHGILVSLENLRDVEASTGGDQPTLPRDAMFLKPTIATIPRIAVGSGTVGGLLAEDEPLIPGKTLIFLNCGEVATEKRDDRFLFGPGTDARQCPFKQFYFKFSGEVATRLADMRRSQEE